MANNKKGNGGVKFAAVVLAALIIVFGLLLTYMRYKDMSEDLDANKAEEKAAREEEYENLYKRITSMNEANYPAKPDDVMKLYSEFYIMIYSNYLDDDRLREAVIKGRIFFGRKLLELNPEDSELLAFEKELNYLNELDVQLTAFEIEPCLASEDDKGVYTCLVTRKLSNSITTSWKYYLEESAGGLYKIRAWERIERNDK